MAGNNKRRNRRLRRGKRSGRRNKMSSTRVPPSAIRNNSTVSVKVPAIRDFTVYSVQPNAASSVTKLCEGLSATKSMWLDALKVVGLFALKIFVSTLLTTEKVIVNGLQYSADKSYITSAVQSVFIGAEDLLKTSALCETSEQKADGKVYKVPCIDYRQARMTNAVVRLTPGSELSRRAGRYAAVCMNISEEEWSTYVPTTKVGDVVRHDEWTFQEVVQMPGAIVAPFGTPLTVRWKAHPYSYANRFLAIGQKDIDGWDFTTNLFGGKPAFRLVIAYQSFASASGDISDTYSPNDALLQVDIRAQISLLESGRSYIRSWPLTTMDTSQVGVLGVHGRCEREVPLSEFGLVEGGLYHLRAEELSLDDLSMDG